MDRRGGNLVQGLAQGAVGGDVLHGKHGFEVTILQVLLHAALKSKHGRVLEKHHGQCAHQTIMEALVDFAGLPGVVDLLEKLGEGFSHGAEAQMFLVVHAVPLAIDNLLESIAIKGREV